jgi:hypothetical protein
MLYSHNCLNNARQGANTETYKIPPDDSTVGVERNWQVTRQKIKEAGGGIVLIQFGSGNENSLAGTKAEREIIFKNNLRFYITETRNLNTLPILITPPEGRDDGTGPPADGSHPNTHGLFPEYVREIATETGVELLDLHVKSNNEFAKYSDSVLLQEFGDCYYTTSGTNDRVHYEPHGAKKVAGWVKELACTTLSDKSLCVQFRAPVDRIIPEIDLTGAYTVTLAPNQPFNEPGATAFDDQEVISQATLKYTGLCILMMPVNIPSPMMFRIMLATARFSLPVQSRSQRE